MTAAFTIYHNPDCGTSRNVLAAIREAGHAPVIVDYRRSGWTRPQLETLFNAMGVGPREMLRDKGTPAGELELLDPTVSDNVLLEAMVEHPILVNRPIVVSPKGTKLCRPSDTVRDLI